MKMIHQAIMGHGLGTMCWRFFVVTTGVLLLTAQIGLAVHASSHLHEGNEIGDCPLCFVGAHFVADAVSPANPPTQLIFVALTSDNSTDSSDAPLASPSVRGPPATSV